MIDDRVDELVELQKRAESLNVDVDCGIMYRTFYDQHKEKHGSFVQFMKAPGVYDLKMRERHNWIYSQIAQTIDTKYQMSWKDQD